MGPELTAGAQGRMLRPRSLRQAHPAGRAGLGGRQAGEGALSRQDPKQLGSGPRRGLHGHEASWQR